MTKQNEVIKLDLLQVNYAELDERVEVAVKGYRNIVISEDNLDEVAKGKAAINKVIKEINAERIKIDKEWRKPLVDLKNNYDARIKKAEEVVDYLSDGLNEFETKRRAEIKNEVEYIYSEYEIDVIPLSDLFENTWYNKTVKHDVECRTKFKRIESDLKHLTEYDAELRALALNNYKKTHDITQALSEANRIKKEIDSYKPIIETKESIIVETAPIAIMEEPKVNKLTIEFETISDFEKAVELLEENRIKHKIV